VWRSSVTLAVRPIGRPILLILQKFTTTNVDTRPGAQNDALVPICTPNPARFSKLTSRGRLVQNCSAEVPGCDLRHNINCSDITSLAVAAGKWIEIRRMSQVTRHTVWVQVDSTWSTARHTFIGSVLLWCMTNREFLPPLLTSTKTQTSSFLSWPVQRHKQLASSLDLYKDTNK